MYEWTVLNPINFILVVILELGLKNSPKNNSIRYWLVTILSKLGVSGRMNAVASEISGLSSDDFINIGAKKYSHFMSFGVERELDTVCTRYDKYFFDTLTEKKE